MSKQSWFFVGICFFLSQVAQVSRASCQVLGEDARLEDTVVRLLKKLSLAADNGRHSVKAINNQIITVLLKGLNHSGSSIVYPFEKWKALFIKIATSADGNLRIYAWDTRTGGTMLSISSIVQFRDSHGIHARILFDAAADKTDEPGDWYTHIYGPEGGGIYIGRGMAQYSTIDAGAVAQAFRIGSNGLNDTIRLFRDAEGLKNKLEVDYNSFRSGEEAGVVHYDGVGHNLWVRRVNDDARLLKGYDVYHFDGTRVVIKK